MTPAHPGSGSETGAVVEAVEEKEVRELVPPRIDAGARGILESPLNKVIA